MNWMPQGLGAEPKKLAILGGLIVLSGIGYYFSHDSAPDAPPAAATTASKPAEEPAEVPAIPVRAQAPAAASSAKRSPGGPRVNRLSRGADSVEAFHPSIKPQEGLDLTTVDPTIRLDLLAKLHDLPMQGGARSVFKEGSAPPPEAPAAVTVKPEPMFVGPRQQVVAANVDPAKPADIIKPPPTPIPLKFYGYTNQSHKKAFFLEGEDIFVAGENDVVKNRYKIIKIGVNSAVVEDTTEKNQQTLPLIKEFDG